jgi:Fe2+ or Zn2+ uptake regulation protein
MEVMTGQVHEVAEAARSRLQRAGLRATRPRVLVYSLLRQVGGHRSVDEIVGLLEERGNTVPRMSAYNVVADLAAAGLLLCADVGPGSALYEASDTWHHHFICRVCGTVADIPCVRGEKPCLAPPASFPGTVDEAQVIFRGICESCIRSSSRTS